MLVDEKVEWWVGRRVESWVDDLVVLKVAMLAVDLVLGLVVEKAVWWADKMVSPRAAL